MAIDKTNIKHLTNTAITSDAKGLISILDIDGNKYELHDKCVDEVVKEVDKVEERVTAVEGKVGTVDVEELKETVEGFLGDSDTTLKDIDDKLEELEEKQVDVTDSAVKGKYVTHVTKDDQGVISSEKADLNAAAVAATKGQAATTVQDWLAEIQALLDTDGGIVTKVQQIVKELEEAEGDGAWNTIVDKLRGLGEKTVKEYVDDAITTAKTELIGGDTVTSADDTIKGAKKYADEKDAALKSELEGKINALDGDVVKTVNDQKPDSTGNVTVTAADINITYTKAGGKETDTLENFLDEKEQVTAAALTDLDSKIKQCVTNNDIEEKNVNSTTFSYANGTLSITTTANKVVAKKA